MFEFNGKDIKLFISQPMNGKDNDTIRRERDLAVKICKEKLAANNIEVLDTLFDFEGKSPLYYLAKSLEAMDEADVCCFYKGWEQGNGCVIEWMAAKSYGKKIIYI